MRRESKPIGQFFISYTDKPNVPIKTMSEIFYAFNWANKVCKSQRKPLSIFQYLYEEDRSIRLVTVSP